MFVAEKISSLPPVTTADCGPSTDGFGRGVAAMFCLPGHRKMIIQRCPYFSERLCRRLRPLP